MFFYLAAKRIEFVTGYLKIEYINWNSRTFLYSVAFFVWIFATYFGHGIVELTSTRHCNLYFFNSNRITFGPLLAKNCRRLAKYPVQPIFDVFWPRKGSNVFLFEFLCQIENSLIIYHLLGPHLLLFAVFTKDYGFRNFRKHSETFGKFRRSVIRLYNFYILYRCSNVILVIFLSPLWYFWPQILCKVIKSTKWFRIFRNVSETFGNINPSWKRLLSHFEFLDSHGIIWP